MEKKLLSYLKKHDIQFKEHFHPAVFTVEESINLKKQIPKIFHTKNLFLKDEAKKFYLVCMDAHEKLNLKALKEKLNAKKKLSFASPKQLKEHLNLTPGSVSIFGMISATSVFLIIDKKIWDAERVGFHPNINTSTLELTHENLEKFYNSLNSKKLILDL